MLTVQFVSDSESREITLDRGLLLIGRDPPAEGGAQVLALPDPKRVISRLHARIEHRDDGYFLTDTSTNGTFVNDAVDPLGKGNTKKLQDGDCLLIGDYRLQIRIPAEDAVATQIGPVSIPVDGISPDGRPEETSASSPFGGDPLLEVPAEASSGPEDPFDIPEEFFSGLEEIGDAPERPVSSPPPADLLLSGSQLQEPFPLPPTETGRPLDREPPSEPDAAAEPEPSSSRESRPDAMALDAFLAGCGLDGKVAPEALPEDVHRVAGTLLRIVIQGLMDLLRARSQLKNELRMDMTVLGAMENNPLKFGVTAEEALCHLLKPEPGYLGGEAAVREAVDDLIAHQVAMISGMQAALKAVLARFDPEALERRAEKLYPIASHMPLQRRARLWNLFVQHYEETVRGMEEDFVAMFGRRFAECYEEQVEQLRRRRS